VPFNEALSILMLIGGWICLIISICISLVAFKIANKAINEQIIIEKENLYKEGNVKNKFEVINTWLNNSTGIFFVLGIASILIFLIKNILIGK
jgi:hypothetical protein